MARNRFPRQSDLFKQSYNQVAVRDWFIIPESMIEDEKERGPVWNLDTMTPFFQSRLKRLSPLEQRATIACIMMNKDQPLSTPITREKFIAAKNDYNDNVVFRDDNSRRTDNELSGLLQKLAKVGILRLAHKNEIQNTGSRRQNIYIFANPHFEEWFRTRAQSGHRLSEEARQSLLEKRIFSPSELLAPS